MAESKWTGATKRVARKQSDCRVWKVEDGMNHGEEAIRVGVRIGVPFVLINTGTPELGIMPLSDYGACCIRTQGPLDVVESLDHFVT
jgi:hypothetical protein